MSCGDDSTAIFRSNFHHHAHDGGRPARHRCAQQLVQVPGPDLFARASKHGLFTRLFFAGRQEAAARATSSVRLSPWLHSGPRTIGGCGGRRRAASPSAEANSQRTRALRMPPMDVDAVIARYSGPDRPSHEKLSVDEVIAMYSGADLGGGGGAAGVEAEDEAYTASETRLKHFGRWFEPSDKVRADEYPASYYYAGFPGGFVPWQKSGRPVCFWACCGGKIIANPCCNPNPHVQQALADPLRRSAKGAAVAGQQAAGDVDAMGRPKTPVKQRAPSPPAPMSPARPAVTLLRHGRGASMGPTMVYCGRFEREKIEGPAETPATVATAPPGLVRRAPQRRQRRGATEPGSTYTVGSRNGSHHVGKWFEPSDIHRANEYGPYYYYPSYPGGWKSWKAAGRPVSFWTCCGACHPSRPHGARVL